MVEAEQKLPRRVSVNAKRLRISEDGTEGALLGLKCQDCGEVFFGAPRFCIKCTSGNLRTVELSREGRLHTYTVPQMGPPGWQGPVPYILGTAELPEGLRITSEVVDCREQDVRIGMPLELVVRVGGKDKEGNEVVVYKWRPKEAR